VGNNQNQQPNIVTDDGGDTDDEGYENDEGYETDNTVSLYGGRRKTNRTRKNKKEN
jgi:hypothetical protein